MRKVAREDFTSTGPGTLPGLYLRSFWQPIAQSDWIGPLQAKPLHIMSERYTLYRGADGGAHLTDFRCPHRGLQLSVGKVEGDAIRCFYHGWKFDAAGRCVEQPAEPEPFTQKVRIKAYPIKEYLGLVFAYLGEGAPPALPRYRDFEELEGFIENESYYRSCNYFQNLENSVDHAHVGFVHAGQPGSFDGLTDSPRLRAVPSCWGLTCHIERPSGRKGRSQFGMPNVFHLQGLPNDPDIAGHREFLAWWVPMDDESHMQFGVYAVRVSLNKGRLYRERQRSAAAKRRASHAELAERILRGDLRLEDIDSESTDMVRLVDDIAQIGQGRIADRSRDRLGRSDAGIILIRKLWARELASFAAGRPTTQWIYDPDALVVAKS